MYVCSTQHDIQINVLQVVISRGLSSTRLHSTHLRSPSMEGRRDSFSHRSRANGALGDATSFICATSSVVMYNGLPIGLALDPLF